MKKSSVVAVDVVVSIRTKEGNLHPVKCYTLLVGFPGVKYTTIEKVFISAMDRFVLKENIFGKTFQAVRITEKSGEKNSSL